MDHPQRIGRRGLFALAALPAARCAGSATTPCGFGAPNALPVTVAGRLPFVALTVNGWPVTALLDTGAEVTLVAEPLLPSLRLPVNPQRRAFQVGVTGRTETRPLAVLPRLRLGTLDLASQEVGVIAPPGLSGPDGNSPQMVLGGDILSRHDLDLDLPGRRLALHPAQRCLLTAPPFGGPFFELPMRVQRNHILARMEANGRPIEAIVDTGANLIQMSRFVARGLGFADADLAAAPKRRVRGISNAIQESAVVRIDALRIGPEVFRNVPSLVGEDMAVDFIVGTPWLLGRRMFVSYANERLLVSRSADASGGTAPLG
jgi:predicted aspartyl protease